MANNGFYRPVYGSDGTQAFRAGNVLYGLPGGARFRCGDVTYGPDGSFMLDAGGHTLLPSGEHIWRSGDFWYARGEQWRLLNGTLYAPDGRFWLGARPEDVPAIIAEHIEAKGAESYGL